MVYPRVMKRFLRASTACAGFLALLVVYGCDPSGSSGKGGGGAGVPGASSLTMPAAYTGRSGSGGDSGAPATTDQTAGQTGEQTTATQPDQQQPGQTAAAATDNAAPQDQNNLEQAAANAGQTFDGTADHAGQTPAVTVPANGGAKKPSVVNALHKPTKLDDSKKAPPPPAKPTDAVGKACADVLESHGQAFDGCGDHATRALMWGGIKHAFVERFGDWKGLAASVIISAVTMLLTGGVGAVAKVLLMLLGGAATLALLWKLAKELKAGVQNVFSHPEGTREHAEGVWQLSEAVTEVAILGGLVAGGKALGGRIAAGKTPQLELPLTK